jgi:ribosomal protein L44E
VRLGDDIDDYCTRCKRSTDHSVAAMVGDEVQKVACRICHTEHKYRHNDDGKPTKEQMFDKLVATAKEQIEGSPTAAPNAAPAKAKRTRK